MRIFAAYGSTKDISVYTAVGLPPSHIYIVGRPTKKMQQQCQVEKKSSFYNYSLLCPFGLKVMCEQVSDVLSEQVSIAHLLRSQTL